MPNAAVVTTYDRKKFWRILQVTLDNMTKYTNAHGYELITYPDIKQDYSWNYPSWLKIKACSRALTEHPDTKWFMWTDIDNLFINTSISIEDIVNTYATDETMFIATSYKNPYSALISREYRTKQNILTSAFLYRNDKITLRIFDMLYNSEMFRSEEFTRNSNHVYEELAFGILYERYGVKRYVTLVENEVLTSVDSCQKFMIEKLGFKEVTPSSFILATYQYNGETVITMEEKERILRKYASLYTK